MKGSQPALIKNSKVPHRSFAYYQQVANYLKNRAPAALSAFEGGDH